jgi:hypothetical protein
MIPQVDVPIPDPNGDMLQLPIMLLCFNPNKLQSMPCRSVKFAKLSSKIM